MATRYRGITSALAAGWLMLATAGSDPAFAESPSEEKKQALDELRGRIDKLQQELGRREDSRNEVADQLKTSETAISEVNRTLGRLTREHATLSQTLIALGPRRATTQTTIKRERELLARLIRYQYSHGNADAIRLVLSGEDVGLVERRLAYLGYVSRSRSALIETINRSLAELAEVEKDALDRRDDISNNAVLQQQARTALEAERVARQKVMNRIKVDITNSRREIGRLKRDEDRLSKLVDQLARALAEQSSARTEARRRASPPTTPERRRVPGEAVTAVADGGFVGRAFATLRGKLKLPVRGELAGRFGAPREEGGVTWKGLFIRASEGQGVRAVADGQVVYADCSAGTVICLSSTTATATSASMETTRAC